MEAKEKAEKMIEESATLNDKTKLDAIKVVESDLLIILCKKIDSLHGHVFFRNDFDNELIKSSIKDLKYWQEVKCEVDNIKSRDAKL